MLRFSRQISHLIWVVHEVIQLESRAMSE
jgi:hypothetical protein